MKKVIAIGALCATVAGFADGTAISSDIVGYSQKDVGKDYTIVPVQFENVTGGTINLLDYLTTGALTPVSCYGSWSDGTQILVQSGAGYSSYLYASDGYDLSDDQMKEGWTGDDFCLVTSIPVSLGDSVWVYNQNTTDLGLTMSGAVLNDSTKTLTRGASYTLTCNPYPMAVKFSEMTVTGVTPVSCYNSWSEGTQILVQNATGYSSYLYATDGYDLSDDQMKEGWTGDDFCLVSSDAVLATVGQGFWFYNPAGVTTTATFAK